MGLHCKHRRQHACGPANSSGLRLASMLRRAGRSRRAAKPSSVEIELSYRNSAKVQVTENVKYTEILFARTVFQQLIADFLSKYMEFYPTPLKIPRSLQTTGNSATQTCRLIRWSLCKCETSTRTLAAPRCNASLQCMAENVINSNAELSKFDPKLRMFFKMSHSHLYLENVAEV